VEGDKPLPPPGQDPRCNNPTLYQQVMVANPSHACSQTYFHIYANLMFWFSVVFLYMHIHIFFHSLFVFLDYYQNLVHGPQGP
jgi:hypothetical protein